MEWLLVVLGVLGGLFAWFIPVSGKAGIILGLVPALGYYLAIEFC